MVVVWRRRASSTPRSALAAAQHAVCADERITDREAGCPLTLSVMLVLDGFL
jgi:hypothetical protein